MSAPKQAEQVYTLAEAAELKRVSKDHLRRAIKAADGRPALAAKIVGRGYRISASALEAWWNAQADA